MSRVRPRADHIVNAEARAKAIPLYRALRDAGSGGMSRAELVAAALPGSALQDVLLAVHWMRFKGVDIAVVRETQPGEGSRFVLRNRLPGAWDATV